MKIETLNSPVLGISRTSLDHVSATKHLQTETIRTTISNHYTILSEIPSLENESNQESYLESRNLKSIKGPNVLPMGGDDALSATRCARGEQNIRDGVRADTGSLCVTLLANCFRRGHTLGYPLVVVRRVRGVR